MSAPNGFCSAKRCARGRRDVNVDFATGLRQRSSVNRMSYAQNIHAVLVHELGHVLGSLHNCEVDGVGAPACTGDAAEATMYPLYQGDAQLTLAPDDVAGFCFLYGRACGTTADCARGDCVAGECVGCASTADCSGSATCDSSGRCVEPPPIEPPPVVGPGEHGDPCATAADCASDRCLAGSCAPACNEERGCMEGVECTATSEGTRACALAESAFGAACEVGEECQSRLCLLGAGAMSCTRLCGPGDWCPSGTQCQIVETQRVCVLPPAPSGCTIAPRLAPREQRGFFGLMFVAAIAYGFRRNRKRR